MNPPGPAPDPRSTARRTPGALTVAGSDPSGGAGVQADLKTFAAWRCRGMAVIAALTAQDTCGVHAVHAAPADFVRRCVEAVLGDCPPAAVKTGMLHDRDVIEAVAAALHGGRGGPLVVDPVMVATSGARLLRDDAVDALVRRLLPMAALVTPNVEEAGVLARIEVDGEGAAWEAAERIAALGPGAVLVKGGHGDGGASVDRLRLPGGERVAFTRPRIAGARPHGAGCTLSAAVTALLAHGVGLADAVRLAGDWVHAAIAASVPVGRGAVPLDHGVPVPEFGV